MTSPTGNVRPELARIEDEVRQLRQQLAEVTTRTLRAAGAFYTQSTGGVRTFETGPFASLKLPDGTPQWLTVVRDMAGQARIALWDPDPVAEGFQQYLYIYDHLSNYIFTSDTNGGWAEPWLSFMMYPRWIMPAGAAIYLNKSVDVAELVIWEGQIPYVTHPQVAVSGIWGTAVGGPNTTRYRLKLNGTTVGTWDVIGVENSARTFSALAGGASFIGNKNVQVQLTAQTLSGTGSYACQVNAAYMRQT